MRLEGGGDGRPAKGGGDDATEGQTDLDGGKELGRVRQQLQGRLGALAAILGQTRQAATVGRHQRHFRELENTDGRPAGQYDE